MSATHKKPHAPIIRTRVVRWLIVVMVLTLILWFGFIFLGRALCSIAIEQIAEFTNTRIETAFVRFRPNGSVSIEKLVVSPYKKADPNEVILTAEEVRASFRLTSVLLLKPQLNRIDVNDFLFNAQYDVDTGRWNLSAMTLGKPKVGGRMPLVRLENGTLQYTKVSNGQVKAAASMPLAARFGFNVPGSEDHGFEIRTSALSSGPSRSHLKGVWRTGELTFSSGISSADVAALEMGWTIASMDGKLEYDPNDTFSLKLSIRDLHSIHTPPLERVALMGPASLEKSASFAALRRFFNRYSPSGLVDIELKAKGNLNQLSRADLNGTVNCKGVAISYDKFPYTIEGLKGGIDFTQNGATIDNLNGAHCDVELVLNGWTRGYAHDWQYDIRVTSGNMALDVDLFDALSPRQKRLWSAFSPTGLAAIDYHFTRSSRDARTKVLAIEPQGVDALYRGFPYPLKNVTGKLTFDPNTVTISNVVSTVGSQRIALNGTVADRSGERSRYDISIDANDIPLDSTLHDALPERQKGLYSQFSLSGLVDGHIGIDNAEQGEGALTYTADLSFREAALGPDQLPLPVNDVTAKAVFRPDVITIKDFHGLYGGNPVSMSGQIHPGRKDRGSSYNISLLFDDTPLNDDLFDLLPKSARKIVADFQPQGNIDLTADLVRSDAQDRPEYTIIVGCLGNSVILPHLSYPLKNITGRLTVIPDSIVFENVNAIPGDAVWITTSKSYVKLNGGVSLADGAFDSAVFEVDANDIYFERRLGAALPGRIRRFFERLGPSSRFGLDLDELRISLADDGAKLVDANGVLRLMDCSWETSGARGEFGGEFELNRLRITPADDGGKLVDVNGVLTFEEGSLKVTGATTEFNTPLRIHALYKTLDGLQNCRVQLDGGEVKVLGKSFTNVEANIDYDSGLRAWTSENLSADCYDGRVTGRFGLKQAESKPTEYVLQTGFQGVDLQKFLLDTKIKQDPEHKPTTGKMEGSLNVSARVGSDSSAGAASSRIGTCKLSIVDMQVGRLSPLAKLLQVLQLSGPTEFAFDEMFVDSYIKRDELLVRKLDLSGKSAAFYGSGSIDLKSRGVKLDLIARGRRPATDEPSVLESLAEGLGQAVVKVEVTGDFYDPEVVTRPLPFIKGTIELLGTRPAEPGK